MHEFDAILRKFYANLDKSGSGVGSKDESVVIDSKFHLFYAKALFLLGREENSSEFFDVARDRIDTALDENPTNITLMDLRLSCLLGQVGGERRRSVLENRSESLTIV